MALYPVTKAEYDEIVDLANSAYRGDTARQGWTHEADYIAGQRIDRASLAGDVEKRPDAALLAWREAPGGPALGCVWLEPAGAPDTWTLGMLTVRPDLQAQGIGKAILEAAEAQAAARGAKKLEMVVIALRDALIAWYGRRGYALTGERRPFPYGQTRYGEPQRDDLGFVVMEKAL